MGFLFALIAGVGAGYAVHMGRYDWALGGSLVCIVLAVSQGADLVARKVGVLEQYLDAILSSKDTD